MPPSGAPGKRLESSKTSSQPPEWILDKILELLVARTGDDHWKLQEITQAKSAQQQVFVLRFSNESQQQQQGNNHNSNTESSDKNWINALHSGNHRLVLRIWRGGSRWWNLNRNQSPLELAKSEIHGYQVAHQAFQDHHKETNNSSTDAVPKIPRVLHFHVPEPYKELPEPSPAWALLEYVGADESDCLTTTSTWKIDRSYLEGMIKIRREFGFDEPHPRWGRVPVDEALEYASSITDQVLLPLHYHSRKMLLHHPQLLVDESSLLPLPKTFSSMVQVYRNAWEETTAAIQCLNNCDSKIEECLNHLDKGISCLSQIMKVIPPLDPVLLHLDLQPQNLIFYLNNDDNTVPRVFSVLDWEDAAWGDPRFDLVLVCRKVCANRDQANALWAEYNERASNATFGSLLVPHSNNTNPLGPMEPWLRLETVHSIATMLLQSMDLVNGGRNPWETKTDLWGKLEREFARLKAYDDDDDDEGIC